MRAKERAIFENKVQIEKIAHPNLAEKWAWIPPTPKTWLRLRRDTQFVVSSLCDRTIDVLHL